jgi:peptidoglycan hydrolase-like protein with peptidoglycan-binding domain
MDHKGHADIDYNELIRNGVVYAGRMDNVGGHTLNLNSQSYGVCIIGKDGDANDLDLLALQQRYRYACDRAGRMLTIVGHREAPGQKPTSCPGSEILDWIHRGLVDDNPTTPAPADWTEEIIMGLPVARAGHHSRKTVATIQGLMNRDAGADSAAPLAEDGVWGPKTDNRVRGWQARHNVPNSVRSDGTGDGVFGRQSWTFALNLD